MGVRADGPLRPRVAALDDGRTRLVIAALDALSVSAAVVARIRAALPGVHIMVAATHTHRSGALVRCGVVEADADYQERRGRRPRPPRQRGAAALISARFGAIGHVLAVQIESNSCGLNGSSQQAAILSPRSR